MLQEIPEDYLGWNSAPLWRVQSLFRRLSGVFSFTPLAAIFVLALPPASFSPILTAFSLFILISSSSILLRPLIVPKPLFSFFLN